MNTLRNAPVLPALVLLGAFWSLVGCEPATESVMRSGHNGSHTTRDEEPAAEDEPNAKAEEEASPSDSSFDPNDRTMKLEVDGTISTVHYQERGGLPIAFGDIVLPEAAGGATVATSVAHVTRWPNGVIPYVVALPEHRAAVADGIALWTSKTSSVRFVPRTTETAYIEFYRGEGCYSLIGRVGGKQQVSLGKGCEFGEVVAHELGHAMGLWHEQSRADRDSFVTIRLANVESKERYNFDKLAFASIGSFDLASIMLYDSTAFSSNGQPTIVRKDGSLIERNSDVSAGDIAGIEQLYGSTTTPTPTPITTPNPSDAELAITLANLNLRSGPGTAYSVLTTIPDGEVVELTGSESGDWLSVRYNGVEGWAYSWYLW